MLNRPCNKDFCKKEEAVSKEEAAFFHFQFFGWVYAQGCCIK
jgi:hypothetical protein